ncbi:MAG: RNA-binding protein [Alphaproteobacteria bacterium]|nr:RNA-binding protein [Alphaproteobacteria bacterium]MDP6516448.1 RNA-binding protein [Alphaproteobacteria bacterium]
MTRVPPGTAPGAEGGGPHRRCLVSGEVVDKAALVRFVTAPDGHLVPDVAGRLPGRGLWVGAQRELVDRACRRGHFARAARTREPAVIESGLSDRIEHLLARRALDYLGFARRSGLLVIGFEQVRAALSASRLVVVVSARDGAAGGRKKLSGLARAGATPVQAITLFDGAELGSALGRDRVVHAGLMAGRLTTCFVAEARRLAGFRPE